MNTIRTDSLRRFVSLRISLTLRRIRFRFARVAAPPQQLEFF